MADEAHATPREAEACADDDWLCLTEGMSPYERFRFIVRHLLQSAVKEAADYCLDARIFPDLAKDASVRYHLLDLDTRLSEDRTLTRMEKEVLCDVVAEAMRAYSMDPNCIFSIMRDHGVRQRDRTAGSQEDHGQGHGPGPWSDPGQGLGQGPDAD